MLVGHVRRREIGGGRLVPLAFAGLALLGCERNPSPIDGGPPSADSSGDAGVALGQAPVDPAEAARWAGRAAAVTIIRDTWGIPHVYGKTDADAVFGMIYAQAEDDFGRVENNYLTALGMLAQVEGEAAIWKDLRARLYVSPEALERLYSESPPWLRELMDGWADGLNFFLYTHAGHQAAATSALRAVDGVGVLRGQHRRRHRADRSRRARAVLRRCAAARA